jgi:hypothetical protein
VSERFEVERDDEAPEPALAAAIERWKEAAPPLEPHFERRVLAALRKEAVPSPFMTRLYRPALLAASLAALVFGAYFVARAGGWIREAPGRSSGTMLIAYDALGEVREAEEAHRRALVRLQSAAQPILARADDPAASAREAALLLSYRDRLRYLDSTIAEIVERVDENPYNAKGRAVLLAAYSEKADILRDVLALAVPPPSIGGA